ncbi:MAG: beta-ketoacyl-ACP synthase [Pseudomonadales bacterium]
MQTFVEHYTLTSALGLGLTQMRDSLRQGASGLSNSGWPDCDVPCYLGRVDALDQAPPLPAARISRNNALIALALAQDGFAESVQAAVADFGPERVGLVMGTSTSSIDRTEAAYRSLDEDGRFTEAFRQPLTHNPHAPGDFVAAQLGLEGPRITISAACASSAKVFASAERWLQQGLVDAVVVGGADSLCLSVIYGFHSLQLVSPEPCQPFAPDRQGISLGEAAGFALLTRQSGSAQVQLLGVGESCDAYHMSSAHPDGLGARLSMQRALAAAGRCMKEIDYVNLHGTGTRANDATEGKVCGEMLSSNTLASATKGWTGHTLGAAGIVESVMCLDALVAGFVPGTINTRHSEAPFELLLESCERSLSCVLTNSFGFGGNNCSVVFART